MPSVASEAPALMPTLQLPPPRPQPADGNAPPLPFESMLDDTQAAAPPPPSQSTANSNTQSSSNSQPCQPQAPSTNATSAKNSGDAATPAAAPLRLSTASRNTQSTSSPQPSQPQALSTNATSAKNSDEAATSTVEPNANAIVQSAMPFLTGKVLDDTKATGPKGDDIKGDGDKAKTKAKTNASTPAGNALTTPDPTNPAPVPVVTVQPAPAPTDAAQVTPVADAAAVLAAAIAPATKQTTSVAPSTPALQTDPGQSANDIKVALKDSTAAADNPPLAAADGNRPAAAHIHSEENANTQTFDGAQSGISTDPQSAASKPTDATQTLVLNGPSQGPAADTSAAAAPTPQVQQQPAPQAVPLAGVGLEIAGKALAGKNHFDIRLDPPELGRIEVRLDVSHDGSISSHVIADRKDTLDLLQRDSSGLQRALEDAGLKTSDQGMQFSLRDQSSGQQQNTPAANPAQPVVEDEIPIEVLPINYSRLAGSGSGLDIRV